MIHSGLSTPLVPQMDGRDSDYSRHTTARSKHSGAEAKRKPWKKCAYAKKKFKAADSWHQGNSLSEGSQLEYRGEEARRRFLKSPFLGAEYQRRLTIGRLKVNVVEATNLPAADLGGTSDPYVMLTLTGRNKWNQEWDQNRQQAWRSKVVKKNLSPRFHEETTFFVNRFDTILRVEVYDSDLQTSDDLLGSLEIQLADLAGRSPLKNWFQLQVETGYTAPFAAVHLHLSYDVSAIGEAISMVWCEDPRREDKVKFDINTLIFNWKNFKREIEPYLAFVTAWDHAIRWTDPARSRKWLISSIFLALFASRLFEIIHLIIAGFLIRQGLRRLKIEKVKQQAAETFRHIDIDGSNSLDRDEISRAMHELAIKRNRPAPCPAEIDELFEKANISRNGALRLDEFTQMLLTSPAIMGVDILRQKINVDETVRDGYDENKFEEVPTPSRVVLELPHSAQQTTWMSLSGAIWSLRRLRQKMRPQRCSTDESRERDEVIPRSPSDDRGDVQGNGVPAVQQSGGPVKGVSRKIINIAGRKAGPVVAEGTQQLGSVASNFSKIREVFEWEEPYISALAVFFNFCLALAHYLLPIHVFALTFSLGVFFVMSEKKTVLSLIMARGVDALARYRWHLREHKGEDPAIFKASTRPIKKVVSKGSIVGSRISARAFKAVVQGIFSRLDSDGSGKIDANDLCTFILNALPAATPRIQASLGDEASVLRSVTRLVSRFDQNGDGGIDVREFEQVVCKTGTVEVLIQEELSRQLRSENGLKCIKLPSFQTGFGAVFRSHQTALTVTPAQTRGLGRDDKLENSWSMHNVSYITRNGEVRVLTPQSIRDIKACTNKQRILISYKKEPSAAENKVLILSVSEALRDPLIDLLRTRIVQLPHDDISSDETPFKRNNVDMIPQKLHSNCAAETSIIPRPLT